MTSTSFRKQFPLNLSSNIAYFIVTVFIGIWIVPYLIKHLGVEGYGFIPLATSVTAYVSLITLSLNGAVARYLVIAVQKNDADGANKIFNSAFFSLALLSIVLVPLSGVFSFLTPKIFNIPSHLIVQVQLLFFVVLVSFIVSVFSSVFSVSTFVNNRLDLRNVIDVGNTIFRTVFIVIFFLFLSASHISVGVAYLLGSCVSLWLGYYYFRRLTPTLSISTEYFDYSKLKELTSMGGWLVFNQIGSLLFLQIDLIIANMLFGAHKAGEYGAIIQWSFLLRSLAGVIAGVLSPMVFISYAKDDTAKIISMSQRAVKFMGLGMAVPIGLLCGLGEPILTVWLGEDFSQYSPLLFVLTFHLVINLAVLPLFSINNAYNRLKVPGWVTFVMGVANLLLAIILGKYVGWGLYGIAAAGAIVLTLKNVIFTPVYAAHILKIPYHTFIKPIGTAVLLAGVSMGIGLVLNHMFLIDGWLRLFLLGGIAFTLMALFGFILLGRDRDMLFSILKVN